MSRDEFQNLLNTYWRENKSQRFGQAVFNTVYTFFPEEVNKLRGSLFDPFYNDGAVDGFLDRLGIV